MITETEIRDQVFRVLINESSLNELELWLAKRAWNAAAHSQPNAVILVDELEHSLADFSRHFVSKAELFNRFRELTNFVVAGTLTFENVAIPKAPVSTVTRSSSYWASPRALSVTVPA